MNAKKFPKLLLMVFIMMTSIYAVADSGSLQGSPTSGHGSVVLDLQVKPTVLIGLNNNM